MSSIKDVDESIDAIIKEAEKKKLMILKEAEKKAEEILKRPIPVEEYRREAEALIASARVKHDEIIEKAKKDVENLRNIPQERVRKAVEYVVKTVVGL
ncbi:hypothetical protein [Desulfurococcus amylolyticus]|uniref:Uncharacterized protein n=1 Tax=Desulfurococcus amylolyticus DSM 16532 TaxID=768672 RepID=I3XSQ7_DESAM|nr:hypothetical protein [Desulfurococcus amylolyticus]AFL66981.1 hypothetical protein Desfe_1109 [Desulfurococcus amylolyticus DSM 16532]